MVKWEAQDPESRENTYEDLTHAALRCAKDQDNTANKAHHAANILYCILQMF